MRSILILTLLSFCLIEKTVGQCSDSPQPVDYIPAHVLIGDVSFFFKYNQTNGYQLWKGDANGQNGQLVKILGGYDSMGSIPNSKIVINGLLYFMATDAQHGTELWKTDGTESGTILVKDINIGAESTLYSDIYSSAEFTDVNGTLYFSTPNRGLWKSNGTSEGTVPVAPIDNATSLVNLNGTLYFIKDGKIWKSTGLDGGTALLNQTNPEQFYAARHLTNVNGTLFFMAYNNSVGYELWKTDGTDLGTVLVKDINSGGDGLSSSYYDTIPFHFTNVNGVLFFYANNGVNGNELWKSDGTSAGTVMVKDIFTGYGSSVITDNGAVPINNNGVVYFFARTTDYNDGPGLWKSDGTEAGTVLVKDLSTISLITYDLWNTPTYYPASSVNNIKSINGSVYFGANNDYYSIGALCKTDGTPGGTIILKQIIVKTIAGINNTAYISASNNEFGTELWKSDGTLAGTVLVKDIHKGVVYSGGNFQSPTNDPDRNSSNPGEFINLNGTLLFTATDGISGQELWKSDGTEAGTSLVKDIDVRYSNKNAYTPAIGTLFESNIPYAKNLNGTFIFSFWGGSNTLQLWKSDGTTNGTTLLNENLCVSNDTTSFVRINNTIYFAGKNEATGAELWKTNGTVAGTVLVKNIYDAKYKGSLNNSSNPAHLFNFNNTLFFIATDSLNGRELWKSDGTSGGTMMVTDFRPGSDYFGPYSGFDYDRDRKIFFNLNNQLIIYYYNQLWKTDGTEQGITFIQSFYNTSINNFNIVINNILYFSAAGSNLETYKLWRSDGTTDGTSVVKDIAIDGLNISNNQFLFTTGRQLWRSNGTDAGTTLVKDFGDYLINSLSITKINNGFVFIIRDDFPGNTYALWYTDGTTDGTLQVKNNFSGGNLFSAGQYAYFIDGYGTQLWKTNGTANGTVIVKSINNGTFDRIWPDATSSWAKSDGNLYVRENLIVNSAYVQSWNKISLSSSPLNINLSSTNTPSDDINSGTKNTIAANSITASNRITGTAKVTYLAGKSITLNQGFKADGGTVFKAEMGGCQ